MARKTVDRTLADKKLAKKKRDKRLSSLPYISKTKGKRAYETVDKTLKKRRAKNKKK